MPSLEIFHFSKDGKPLFNKDVELCYGSEALIYGEELHSNLQELKTTFAAILQDFPVASTRFQNHPNGDLRSYECRSTVLSFLSQIHRFLKICGEFFVDFEIFVDVANRRVTELVHSFNHQSTINFKGFSGFETLVEDCLELVNNDSFYQSRIKFQRAMATHMELLASIRDYSRVASNQITCIAKAQVLVDFSRKIAPFLEMVGHYVDRLCEQEVVVCAVRKMHAPVSCWGHDHRAFRRVCAGLKARHTLFPQPESFLAMIQEHDETLAQVKREASKSEWLMEHFYKCRILPVQEGLHETIVWREKSLGEGIICD